MTKEQNERNLIAFVELLKTTMSDVGSFRKAEISTYFLMMRKFFKNYVNENNALYEVGSPMRIGEQEAENIKYFFNSMIAIFEKPNGDGYLHELEVLNGETLKQIAEQQFRQIDDIQNGIKQLSEHAYAHSHKLESVLKEIGIER